MNKIVYLILGILLVLPLVSASYGIGGGSSYGIGAKEISGTTNINNSYTTNNNNYYNGTSYNVSYDAGIKWFYNMSLPFIDWLSTFNYNYNQTYTLPTYLSNFTNGTTTQTCNNYLSSVNWSFFKSGVYNNFNEATFFNNTNISGNGIYLTGTNLTGTFNSMVFTNGTSSYWNITLGVNVSTNTNLTLQTRTANSYNISDSGLVALWGLNNGTGESATKFVDSTGRNNGTCVSSLDYCPILIPNGTVGNAMQFDGVNDYMVTNSINSDNYSVSMWMNNQRTSNLVINGYFFSKGKPFESEKYDAIGVTGTLTTPVNRLLFWNGAGGGTIYFGSVLNTAQWNHIVFIRTGTNVTFYVNGVFDGNATATITYTQGNISLGVNGQGWYYEGYIDEVRIYNRSLSATEVQNLYNLGSYHISDWSAWSSPVLAQNNVPITETTGGKFMQYRTNFFTNNTQISPFLLNYSVSKSYGGVNTTTCVNITTNSTLDFGDTVLIAKDYLTHSLYYTGDALALLSNVKADSKDIGINGIKQIDHSTINIMASTRNGVTGQSVDKTLAVLIKANQQLIIKNTELETKITKIKDCAKQPDYKTYSECILK